jgi:peptidoglycan/xylan/chitin deacetylase (PgdA/CDA1 family)
MRLDRIASVHLVHPIARMGSRRAKARIPILMYHSISDQVGVKHPYFETNTSPKVFEQQIKFLSQNGYSAVSLEQAVNSLQAPKPGPKPVVITFDDGYRDFYTAAYPVLSEYGMTATMFVVSGLTGHRAIQFNGRDCLTWTELKELRSNGIQIGSHTVTHPELALMDPAGIDDEIGRSKQTIEDKIGAPVKSFSYPYAFPEANRTLVALLAQTLEKYGYENGVSTILGTARRNNNRFFIPRIPVNTWDDLRFFRAKLEGGYDWLHVPQVLSKALKGSARSGRQDAQALERVAK